jgi:hypothetical protein
MKILVRIRGSASGSIPKRHGSGTLVSQHIFLPEIWDGPHVGELDDLDLGVAPVLRHGRCRIIRRRCGHPAYGGLTRHGGPARGVVHLLNGGKKVSWKINVSDPDPAIILAGRFGLGTRTAQLKNSVLRIRDAASRGKKCTGSRIRNTKFI